MPISIFWKELQPPPSDRALHKLIETAFGLYIPDVAVCPGHTAPFQFVADIYFERTLNALCHGNRGGGKTWNAATLHALNSRFKEKCWTTHLGATENQAHRCYVKFREYTRQPFLDWLISGEPLMGGTEFGNGSRIEILTGTLKQTSGPHPQKVCVDEVEDMPWEVHQNLVHMATTTHGIPAQTWRISANRLPTGTMALLLDSHEKRGMALYKYCVLEVIKPEPKCKGKEDCPIYDYCQRRCERAHGFVEKRDVFEKFRQDPEGFPSQQLGLKPSAGSLEFSEYDEAVHVGNYPYQEDGDDPFLGFDWGWFPDASHVSVIQRQAGRPVAIDEVHGWRKGADELAASIRALPYGKRIKHGYGDPSAAAGFSEFRSVGIDMRAADNDVEKGLNFLHNLFSTKLGPPSLLVNRSCNFLRSDLKAMPPYRTKPKAKRAIDGQQGMSHYDGVASLRYGVFSEFGSHRTGDFHVSVIGTGGVKRF